MTLSHNTKVRSLQVINHILLVVGLMYVFYSGNYDYLWWSLGFYWFTGVFGINIGMHRLLSHRSFETWTWMEKFLSLVATITGVGSPLAWAAVHRQHHTHTETNKDPHSPILLGNWRAWWGFWNYVRLNPKLVKDLRKDKFQIFLHKHYIAITILYCLILSAINPWLIVFVYAIPATLCLHSTSSIIVIAHRHGYVSHPLENDQSKNSWIASLITLGEGWHNNHHANCRKLRQGERWWELDPPAFIIENFLMKKSFKNS